MKTLDFINKKREGFFMIELILAIIIISAIFLAVFQKQKRAKIEGFVRDEIVFFEKIEDAIKVNFVSILDAFENPAATVSSDALNDWGWRSATTRTTSPFPTFNAGTKILTYNVRLASLPTVERAPLQQSIGTSLSGICTPDATTATTLTFYCPRVVSLTYNLGAGNVLRAHALGTEINPKIAPTVNVTYDKNQDYKLVPAPAQPVVSFSTNDVYTYRRSYSLNKLNTVRNAAKKFYNQRLLVEFGNPPDGGLNSMDDEFVPWMWQMFANNIANTAVSCVRNAAGKCSNMDSTIWRTSLSGKGLFTRRIQSNITSDQKYNVDGFNNQLVFYPFASDCAGTDFFTCATVMPPQPEDNYISLATRPPYVSVLYTRGNSNKNVSEPDYVRTFISY